LRPKFVQNLETKCSTETKRVNGKREILSTICPVSCKVCTQQPPAAPPPLAPPPPSSPPFAPPLLLPLCGPDQHDMKQCGGWLRPKFVQNLETKCSTETKRVNGKREILSTICPVSCKVCSYQSPAAPPLSPPFSPPLPLCSEVLENENAKKFCKGKPRKRCKTLEEAQKCNQTCRGLIYPATQPNAKFVHTCDVTCTELATFGVKFRNMDLTKNTDPTKCNNLTGKKCKKKSIMVACAKSCKDVLKCVDG